MAGPADQATVSLRRWLRRQLREPTPLREHLEAALAVWQYNEESVAMLFKQKSGSSLADKLFLLLARGPMTTTEFHKHVGGSSSTEIRESLERLLKASRITMTKISQNGAGRPSEQWKRADA